MWRRVKSGANLGYRGLGRRMNSSNSRIGAAAWAYVRMKNAMSFSGYSLLVLGGLAITGYAGYCIVDELVLPSSDVRVFQRAFKMIEADEKVQEMLGKKLKAFGEDTHHRAARTRPIASRRTQDSQGRELLTMQFYVQGKDKQGKERVCPVIVEMFEGNFRLVMIELPGYGNRYIVGGLRPKTRQAFRWLLGNG